MQTVTYYSK